MRASSGSQKPVIASVNGFAVGGGNVLQVVCDLTIAAESAIFRQVGPSMGSFDAGVGTWYLEDQIGKKRAKEMWFCNDKYTAEQALAMGLINRVVPDDTLREETRKPGRCISPTGARSPWPRSSIPSACAPPGSTGSGRMAHDLLLRQYLDSDESKELGASFGERRKPDPSKFGH